MRVKLAVAIFSKFLFSNIVLFIIIVEKMFKLRTAYMKIRSISSPPTFIKDGKVNKKVSNTIFKLFYFLKSLNILAILNDLSIIVADMPLI